MPADAIRYSNFGARHVMRSSLSFSLSYAYALCTNTLRFSRYFAKCERITVGLSGDIRPNVGGGRAATARNRNNNDENVVRLIFRGRRRCNDMCVFAFGFKREVSRRYTNLNANYASRTGEGNCSFRRAYALYLRKNFLARTSGRP